MTITTPPPDTKVQSETPEQIATKVVNQIAVGAWRYCSRQWVIGLVAEALRNRDQRAARIIKEHRESDVCEDNCWTTITNQILGKDGNKDERN